MSTISVTGVPYFIAVGVGFVLLVPMLVRELLSLRKKKKED